MLRRPPPHLALGPWYGAVSTCADQHQPGSKQNYWGGGGDTQRGSHEHSQWGGGRGWRKTCQREEDWTVNKKNRPFGGGGGVTPDSVSKGRQRRRCVYFLWICYWRWQRGHDLYSSPRHPEFMHRYDFMKARVFACACLKRSILQDDWGMLTGGGDNDGWISQSMGR